MLVVNYSCQLRQGIRPSCYQGWEAQIYFYSDNRSGECGFTNVIGSDFLLGEWMFLVAYVVPWFDIGYYFTYKFGVENVRNLLLKFDGNGVGDLGFLVLSGNFENLLLFYI